MMTRPHRIGIGLLLLSTVAAAATVRRAEDTTLTGRLVRVQDSKLWVVPDGGATPTAVPLDDLVEVTFADTPTTRPATTRTASTQASTAPKAARPATQAAHASTRPTTQPTTASAPTRSWRLTLAGQDTLTLGVPAWSNGRVSGTIGRNVAVDVPVSAVREVWCGSASEVTTAKALGEKAATDDIAFAVRDGKVIAVHGVAVGVDGDALRFKFGDQERRIGLARLVGVVFAGSAADAAKPTGPQQVLVFSNKDALPGTWTAVDDASVGFITAWGQPLNIPRPDLASLQFRNGRLISLSDLTPANVEQTPYFDRLLPWQVDRSLDGKPLQLSDGPVARGLAVHARTTLTYSLAGGFEQFRSRVGFQLPAGRSGDAVVRVTGDGRTLFEKTDARGTQPPFDVAVNLSGVQSLTLEVDFGQNQDVGDRVVWGNARLLRPQSQTAQTPIP